MLKQLSASELQNVVGGSTKFVKVEGAVHTIYHDEDGVIRCGTSPWFKPKPKPNGPRTLPKL
jgi:bacteriocin-like protein